MDSEFLPPSAVSIHERHDLDTNEIWLSFRFNYSTDITNIMKACKRVTQQDIVYPRKPGRWWPKTLTRRMEDTQRSGSNYEYYRCEDDGIIVIDRTKVDVFYWNSG